MKEAYKSLVLMQVELSAVECYKGAPDLETVDRYIQIEMGFERVHLGATYYNENTGEVQQYDGIYIKKDRIQIQPEVKGIGLGAVVTSLGGHYKRIGDDGLDHGKSWFNSCLASWHKVAPQVISVSEMPPTSKGITWVQTKKKPRIIELFYKLEQVTQGHVVITNADVLLTESFSSALSDLEPEVFYFGNRLDVSVDTRKSSELIAKSYFELGFDFFVVPPKLTKLIQDKKLLPAHLRVGEPWWDYALPLLAVHHGFVTKHLRLDPPAALHFDHPNVSNGKENKIWLEQGKLFLKWCEKLHSEGHSPATGLLQALTPFFRKVDKDPVKSLTTVAFTFLAWMA
jgi:hypothetical protein